MRCFAQQPEAGMVYSRAQIIDRRGEVSNQASPSATTWAILIVPTKKF